MLILYIYEMGSFQSFISLTNLLLTLSNIQILNKNLNYLNSKYQRINLAYLWKAK